MRKGKDFVSVLKDAHPDVPKIGLKAPVPKKNGRLFFFTRMRPGQNDRKHPLLVLLSVLCKSLQRSLIFIALPFSAYALFGKAGAKVRRFLIPSKCFERKVCESWQFFALLYKIRVKKRVFWGKRQEKGDIQGTRPPCHGGGLGGKTGPYRGKTMPWRGETRAGEQRKWGETDGNKSLLRLGSYFLLIIYIAQERRKWPLRV